MALLVGGLLFHYLVRNKAIRNGISTSSGVALACVSIALWFGVIAGAIFIGFV